MTTLFCAVGIAQLSACGIHLFTWWLRDRVLELIAFIGIICLIAFSALQMDGSIFVGGLVLSSIIALPHIFQLRCHREGNWEIWWCATLANCAEIAFALSLSVLVQLTPFARIEFGDEHSLLEIFTLSLLALLLILSLFRPLILRFLRPLVPMLSSAKEKLRLLHPKVLSDVQ